MKKKTTTLLLYLAGIALIAGVAVLVMSREGNEDNTKETFSMGVLTAIDNQFDFNTVYMNDGTVSHDYEVMNNSTESVTIEKVYTSCGCTTASIVDSAGKTYGIFSMPGHGMVETNIVIEPGESIIVEAIFDPAAHGPSGVGLAQRLVYLETNSTQSPKLDLFFQATVIR